MTMKTSIFQKLHWSLVWLVMVVFLAGLSQIGLKFSSPESRVSAQADACNQYQCSRDDQDEDGYLDCIKNKQSCLQGKIDEAKEAQNTLSNTIIILSNQISVQELQIEQTREEIRRLERQVGELADRIAGLDISLDSLSNVLIKRVSEQYKRQTTNPLLALLTRGTINLAVSEYKYLEHAREQTVKAMELAEAQRLSYDEQKALKEQAQEQLSLKQASLLEQQQQLGRQRADQQYLLSETRQSEARYQAELAKTIAELEAIRSIIAGRGSESRVGEVSAGDMIASVIEGPSACSTGSHLHFEVVKDGTHRDPAGYLRPLDNPVWANGADGAFNFSGDWNWPIDNPARITQGYGMTYYARVRRAYGGAPHTGIDMFSRAYNFNVRAVADGTLFRGSVPCGGGILRYVKMEHNDGLMTYYLHVNY